MSKSKILHKRKTPSVEGCIIEVPCLLYTSEQASLAVNVVGAFAAQEEVGTRGAVVTSQIVKPDLAIVFEGSPSDDFFISAGQAQGCMKTVSYTHLHLRNGRFDLTDVMVSDFPTFTAFNVIRKRFSR